MLPKFLFIYCFLTSFIFLRYYHLFCLLLYISVYILSKIISHYYPSIYLFSPFIDRNPQTFIIISVLCTLLFEIERNKTNYDLEYKFNRKKIVSFINNIYICSRYIIERITCKSLYSSIPLKISSAIRADTIEKVLHPIFD